MAVCQLGCAGLDSFSQIDISKFLDRCQFVFCPRPIQQLEIMRSAFEREK